MKNNVKLHNLIIENKNSMRTFSKVKDEARESKEDEEIFEQK